MAKPEVTHEDIARLMIESLQRNPTDAWDRLGINEEILMGLVQALSAAFVDTFHEYKEELNDPNKALMRALTIAFLSAIEMGHDLHKQFS